MFPASALQHLHLLFAKKNLVTSGQLIAADYCIMAYGSENNRPPLHRSNPKPEALNRTASQIKAPQNYHRMTSSETNQPSRSCANGKTPSTSGKASNIAAVAVKQAIVQPGGLRRFFQGAKSVSLYLKALEPKSSCLTKDLCKFATSKKQQCGPLSTSPVRSTGSS